MNRLLLVFLVAMAGCGVFRQSYRCDRLQDSIEKQEQKKFNAEVLRRMEELDTQGNLLSTIKFNAETFKSIEARIGGNYLIQNPTVTWTHCLEYGEPFYELISSDMAVERSTCTLELVGLEDGRVVFSKP